MIITRTHLDEMPEPYCARGARRWFASMGWDWGAFVRDGIESDTLLATGNAMAIKLVEHAEKTHGQ